MSPVAAAAAGGAVAGAGLLLLVRQLHPPRIPLTLALQRLEQPATPRRIRLPEQPAAGWAGWSERLGGWLADRNLGRPLPTADLALLEMDPATFCLRKVAMAIFGLLLPGLTAAAVSLTGVSVAPTLPAGTGVILAVVLFFAPDLVVGGQAREARQSFSAAVGAYLDLVALERAADGAPAEALTRAATVADSWPFRRIRQTLEQARLAGSPPWHALAGLADDVGVSDLRDLADILSVAGDDGAAVYDALSAKAASLRGQQLAAAKTAANTASEKLTLPGVLLCFGFLLLVCYPAIARVLGV